jgi:hypothetical protein
MKHKRVIEYTKYGEMITRSACRVTGRLVDSWIEVDCKACLALQWKYVEAMGGPRH